jgi:SPP1 family predicted phage head-tail adaptor
MQAGKLDRRVTIQRRTQTQAANGEYVNQWNNVATVWATVKDLRGNEFFAARQTNAEVTTRFYLRWHRDITVLDRILCDGVVYDLIQVSEMGRRQGLEILAIAKVP